MLITKAFGESKNKFAIVKTIGYCSRTKVKSSLILRRFYATWPWALTLGLKFYYLWEPYHASVLVNTLVLSTNVARSTMGLV